jgi:REP element-mobilizing transposase RayT
MPRRKRIFLAREFGSHHIITRIAGNSGDLLFGAPEKEHLLNMLELYAGCFYVHIHGFAIMSNHLHLVVTERTAEAQAATADELLARYRRLRGPDAEPPMGSQKSDGSVAPDEDGGIERLRRRLGSISRFVQAIKQDFTRWFNKRHGRRGYLWGDRFHDKILERGEAELVVRAYIDLNSVRASIVRVPEDYRWSGMGLAARQPDRARRLIMPLPGDETPADWYRLYVYRTGGKAMPGKGSIAPEIVASVEAAIGRQGIGDMLRYRARNLSEGLALGSRAFISEVQRQLGCRTVNPRPVEPGLDLFVTRSLART